MTIPQTPRGRLSTFERFAVILGYFSVILFLLVLLGVGVTLTLISIGVGLVSYYPLTFADWIARKVQDKSADDWVAKKLKGNK